MRFSIGGGCAAVLLYFTGCASASSVNSPQDKLAASPAPKLRAVYSGNVDDDYALYESNQRLHRNTTRTATRGSNEIRERTSSNDQLLTTGWAKEVEAEKEGWERRLDRIVTG